MTQLEKLKVVVEAAGRCWHETNANTYADQLYVCTECGVTFQPRADNPSPGDLNALFGLARRLNFVNFNFDTFDGVDIISRGVQVLGRGGTPAEALLNALYESVKQ